MDDSGIATSPGLQSRLDGVTMVIGVPEGRVLDTVFEDCVVSSARVDMVTFVVNNDAGR